jgi:hypothetical protein
MLVFKICLDSAQDLLAYNQVDPASLINGIADQLSINLKRKGKEGFGLLRADLLDEACLEFAKQFVDEVWLGVLQGKPPAQKERRLLGSIYRMAFIQAHRKAQKERKVAANNSSETTSENTVEA